MALGWLNANFVSIVGCAAPQMSGESFARIFPKAGQPTRNSVCVFLTGPERQGTKDYGR
jgi:hypothetical protein